MTTPTGFASAKDVGDDFAQLAFLVHQITGGMATGALVEVLSVTTSGGLSPVGYVDVKPLVHQTDGAGNAVPHGPLHNLPYFRLQGGSKAVILDPVKGDIGFAVFASHDTSRVKNTRAAGLPASARRFDWADGFYLGGFLNGTPEQYIQFDANGNIRLKPASKVYVDGDLDVTGDVVANGVSLQHHKHGNVQNGAGKTGEPIA